MEFAGHQRGEEAEVPTLVHRRAATGNSHIKRDQADVEAVLERVPQPPDTPQACGGVHHLHQLQAPQQGEGTGYIP